MKLSTKNSFFVSLLIVCLSLFFDTRISAQIFNNLHSFTAGNSGTYGLTNADGAEPFGGLVLSGNTLYGTAPWEGNSGDGTVFALKTSGAGFTNLYEFTAATNNDLTDLGTTNSDGAHPYVKLVLSGQTLYGTAAYGGTSGNGTVFALTTNGSQFTNLYTFSSVSSFDGPNSDGAEPRGDMILFGNTLYGTTVKGGIYGKGTVFSIRTNGTGFTNLYNFTGGDDGANPYAGVILSGDILYGTTYAGGVSGNGTVFALKTDGAEFTNLHSFAAGSSIPVSDTNILLTIYTNSDGAAPYAGLILSANILYGTASKGGIQGSGTIFTVTTNGTEFTNLYTFGLDIIFTATNSGEYSYAAGTNNDGAGPDSALILSGNTLYGTTCGGGIDGYGTVFSVTTNGTGFVNLSSFLASGNYGLEDHPCASLLLFADTLYGTVASGGTGGEGCVFSLSLPPISGPQLTIFRSGASVILSWTNTAIGFTLQSTTNLTPSAVWSTNLPSPVVANGQNTVTNPISNTQQFYRLRP